MPKLRTMHQNTPEMATHLISDPEKIDYVWFVYAKVWY